VKCVNILFSRVGIVLAICLHGVAASAAPTNEGTLVRVIDGKIRTGAAQALPSDGVISSAMARITVLRTPPIPQHNDAAASIPPVTTFEHTVTIGASMTPITSRVLNRRDEGLQIPSVTPECRYDNRSAC